MHSFSVISSIEPPHNISNVKHSYSKKLVSIYQGYIFGRSSCETVSYDLRAGVEQAFFATKKNSSPSAARLSTAHHHTTQSSLSRTHARTFVTLHIFLWPHFANMLLSNPIVNSPAMFPMTVRNHEELAAAQVLLSVSPASRPSARPRSFSLDALCDVALSGSALQGANSAPSVVLSPQVSKSFSNYETQRTIFATLKRSLPQQDKDEDYVLPKRSQRLSRTTFQLDEKRIGVYTPEERAERISRFLEKRNARVWTKKVRYSCRKNLAQCRTRVKGRFVSSKTLET